MDPVIDMNSRKQVRAMRPRLIMNFSVLFAGFFAVSGWAVQQVVPKQSGPFEVVYSSGIDGTISDGGIYGIFDGNPDAWDWAFNGSGYQGSITLTTETPTSSLERRVVFEYNLATVVFEPPVRAELSFVLRGASVFPYPDTEVHVYHIPADLVESPADYGSQPAVYQGSATTVAFQEPTRYTVDISAAINDAMTTGANKVAFRFQVAPDTAHDRNQAFIDADDDEPDTKPFIILRPDPAYQVPVEIRRIRP